MNIENEICALIIAGLSEDQFEAGLDQLESDVAAEMHARYRHTPDGVAERCARVYVQRVLNRMGERCSPVIGHA